MMKSKWLIPLYFAGLYLLGIWLWGRILNWGDVAPYHDWAEITFSRLAFLQHAVRSGALPLHMADASALRMLTDRFMSIPDVILSPDLLLMRFISVKSFILIHWLLCYTAGFFALVWICIRHHAPLALLTGLFLLFNFNGHIVSHISVGHLTWGGYFYFPWLVILCLELVKVRQRWVWISAVALLMLAIWLQGSFHQYVIGLIFLIVFSLASIRKAMTGLLAAGFSVLLGLVRIVPAVLILGTTDTQSLGGYQLIRYLKDAAVVPRPVSAWQPFANYYSPLGWWEFNIYLGWAGVILLAIFSLGWLVGQLRKRRISALWFPLLIMLYLVVRNHLDVWLGWVPLFSGLRVATRIVIMPIVALAFAGAAGWQGSLEKLPKSWQVAFQVMLWVLTAWLAVDLVGWALHWGVQPMAGVFPQAAVDMASKVVANHPDLVYHRALAAGLAGFLISLLFLAGMVWREQRQLSR